MSLIPENDRNPYSHNSCHRNPPIRKLFSQSTEDCEDALKNETATFQVYLRIKPNPDFRSTVKILNGTKLVCKPPLTSKANKNTEKTEFTFSKIFGPETTQNEVFEETVLPCVDDLIRSHNSLIFSYGTTNAGKTYTVQGDLKNPGLIPRTLHAIFSRITPDEEIKYAPHMVTNVKRLNLAESTDELIRKEDLLRMHASMKSNRGFYPSEFYDEYSQLSESFEDYSDNRLNTTPNCSVWVSFIEVYNEVIYDLLEPFSGNTRPQLKLCADNNKNYFVKGLKQFCVQSPAEAYSIYLYGKKNLNVACTKLNENSSRSHCIFVIKLINQSDPEFVTISSLSICDLAGTERQDKTQNTGARLREAGNINLSLFTLNRCLKTLKENQAGNTNQVMPYRSSKLTTLLCSALLDRNDEKVIMIVNINPSQELYDETQQVLKICAIACEIRSKPLRSARIVRRQTRFSTFVYEQDNEPFTYQPFEYEMSDCEEEDDEIIAEMQRKIDQLEEEKKKNQKHMSFLHTEFEKMLEDSSKFHEKEVEEIREEAKKYNEKQLERERKKYELKIKELCETYELKMKELCKTDENKPLEDVIEKRDVTPERERDTKLNDKIAELELQLRDLQLKKEEEETVKEDKVKNENIQLRQELIKLQEKVMDLESLLNEAKEERKVLDKELKTVITKYGSYREENKVLLMRVNFLEKEQAEMQAELRSKEEEIKDKLNNIEYLEKLIGDKENLKTKKRGEKKKKLYNPLDDDVIFSPEEQNSDRDIFRETHVKNEVATPAQAVRSHRKKKFN